MSVPVIIFHVSKYLAIASLIMETIVGVVSIFYFAGRRYNTAAPALSGLFASGVRVRNSALCFLVLLFLIGTKTPEGKGIHILSSISTVFELYALGSIVVLSLGILGALVLAARSIRSEKAKKLRNRVLLSGLLSTVLGSIAAYFFRIL